MLDKNVLFFLTPKSQVAYVISDYTLRQIVEKMQFHRFSAIPILSPDGKYFGTITEGDILWFIKDKYQLNYKAAEKTPLAMIPQRREYHAVTIDAKVNDLLAVAETQNFVPVVDDQRNFIGIVTRRSIITNAIEEEKEEGKA